MQQFAISPVGMKSTLKSIAWKLTGIAGVALLFCVLLSMVVYGDHWTSASVVISIVGVNGFFSVQLWKRFKNEKAKLMSYTVTVTSDAVKVDEADQLQAVIAIGDVSEIFKGPDGSFLLVNGNRTTSLSIQSGLERADELERLLSTIAPIKSPDKAVVPSWAWRYQYYIGAAVMATIFTMLLAENRYVVTIASAFFILQLLWMTTLLYKTSLMHAKTKQTGYVAILLTVLATLAFVVNKWFMFVVLD